MCGNVLLWKVSRSKVRTNDYPGVSFGNCLGDFSHRSSEKYLLIRQCFLAEVLSAALRNCQLSWRCGSQRLAIRSCQINED